MQKILDSNFFNRPTVAVAKDLLGKFLVRRYRSKTIACMITEVEAYDGRHDKASHAHRGKTVRNFPMFGTAGQWYVYFTYGMYWMLNIVTREENYPAAILIRGVYGISGPGRLTKKLKIDGRFSGLPATAKTGLWIEGRGYRLRDGYIYPLSPRLRSGLRKDDFQRPLKIKKGPRVGVAYAGRYWAKRHLRFWIV